MRIHPELQPFKAAAGRADTQDRDAGLRRACRDFEGLLIEQMLAAMRRSVPESGLFGSSPAASIYESIRDQELARDLAGHGGLGLADALYRQLRRGEVAAGQERPLRADQDQDQE